MKKERVKRAEKPEEKNRVVATPARGAESNTVAPRFTDPGVLEVLQAGAAATKGNGGTK